MGKELIPSQVQSADEDRIRFQGGSDAPISLVLLFLGRQSLPVDVKILRPKQTDALRSASLDHFGVRSLLNVGRKHDADAIQRDGGFLPDFAEPYFEVYLPPRELAIFE